MPNLGFPELLIVLVIVVIIFGANRLTDVMAAMGKGVREFRKATNDEESKPEEPKKSA